MVRAGDRVATAVSGGADSVALLRLLEELRGELGITLLVAHFNHQLRAEADEDERFVAGLAEQLGLEFQAGRADVAAIAKQKGWNLEDAARRLRYEFFDRMVAEGRASRVAVAHTADDQAETVLANLLRGTGLAGLAGIYPTRGGVVRPLLGLRRQELRQYLASRSQPWREDVTNLDATRLRVRIRHELLPVLERDFQPNAVEHLVGLARRAREDEAFWSALIDECFERLVSPVESGLEISVPDLLEPWRWAQSGQVPQVEEEGLRAVGSRLVRRILATVKGDRQRFTARHVEQVFHLAALSASGHRIELPGVVVERRFDRLVFSAAPHGGGLAETPSTPDAYEYEVDLPEQGTEAVTVPEIGRRFSLKVIDWPAARSDTRNAGDALDRDRLRGPLVLRNWRPGDVYRPRGRRHARKLKRLFVERRIGARERSGWPVLTSAGQVVWVRGWPPAEEFAAGAGTRIGVLIDEETV